MDFLSIIGLVMGVGAIITSMTLDGGNVGALLQFSAFVIVGGGTLAGFSGRGFFGYGRLYRHSLFPYDLEGIFVVPHSLEGGMTHDTIFRHFAEGDFSDQHGFEPDGLGRRRIVNRKP